MSAEFPRAGGRLPRINFAVEALRYEVTGHRSRGTCGDINPPRGTSGPARPRFSAEFPRAGGRLPRINFAVEALRYEVTGHRSRGTCGDIHPPRGTWERSRCCRATAVRSFIFARSHSFTWPGALLARRSVVWRHFFT